MKIPTLCKYHFLPSLNSTKRNNNIFVKVIASHGIPFTQSRTASQSFHLLVAAAFGPVFFFSLIDIRCDTFLLKKIFTPPLSSS
ncbi:hypothetical protein L1887_23028 [Cichorium endivia]|nr:hypothetical protein L1887_23028 [Cichorium endivia]